MNTTAQASNGYCESLKRSCIGQSAAKRPGDRMKVQRIGNTILTNNKEDVMITFSNIEFKIMNAHERGAVKTCSECKKTKNVLDFGLNRGMKDGRFNQCKLCRKIARQSIKETDYELYQRQLECSRLAKQKLGKEHLKESKTKWDLKNSEYVKEYRRNYYLDNLDRCRLNGTKHWKSIKRASVKFSDRCRVSNVYKESKKLTRETGIQHSVDHIIPLNGKNVSGLHIESNLQIIPLIDNNRKYNSFTGDIC